MIMHDRSRMTVDPCIPTMPGRSTSGFHRPGRHWLHQARSAMRCWASDMKGELHPAYDTKSRLCMIVEPMILRAAFEAEFLAHG